MTREQKIFKTYIVADLSIVSRFYNSEIKAERMLSAYHMQQAIEKTIKLKAGIKGLNLWGHNIKKLLNKCNNYGIDIGTPSLIIKNANMYTSWEADCRYNPTKVVRKDSIINAYKVTVAWLNSGDTAI